MDPNAALHEIREIRHIAEVAEDHDRSLSDADADRLVEVVRGLDEWLSNGGFRPDAWTAGEDFELTDTGMLGIIQLADGTQSRFYINGDGTWQQWGADTERLGRTVDLLDDINSKFWEQEG